MSLHNFQIGRYLLLGAVLPLLAAPPVLADSIPVQITCHSQSDNALSRVANPFVDGGWYRFRRDNALSGRSPLVGAITCPQVSWSLDLSQRGMWLEVAPLDGSETLPLVHSGQQGDYYGIRSRFLDRLTIDLNGDGQFVEDRASSRQRIGDFLDTLPGLEMISCEPWRAGAVHDGGDDAPCYMLHWNGAGWDKVWETPVLPWMGSPNHFAARPIVADVDNDGEQEVVLSAWFYVYIVNLASGELEATGTFTDPDTEIYPGGGRPYGWIGAFNLDDDPKLEVVMLTDFLPTIQVLGWSQEGEFVQLWDRIIDTVTDTNEKIHMVTANAVQDVTGDGLPDIVTNIHNENQDNAWHLMILNGMKGASELDIKNYYAEGVWDLDHDGIAEILATTTSGRRINENGPAILLSALNGQRTELFRKADEHWHWSMPPNYPANINSDASLAQRHPTILQHWDSRGAIVATDRQLANGDTRLTFYAKEGNGITAMETASGPGLTLLGGDEESGSGTALLRASFQAQADDEIVLNGMHAQQRASRRLGRGDGYFSSGRSLLAGTVVLPRETKQPLVVSEGSGDSIQAYRIDLESRLPELQWRARGHGMFGSISGVSKSGHASVLGFQPFKSGVNHIAVARQGQNSGGAIAALRPDGSTLWERELETQSAPAPWNYPGIIHWLAGNFSTPDRQDVYVVLRRSNFMTEMGFMLNGRTGEVLWSKKEGAFYNKCDSLPPSFWLQGGPNIYQSAVADWSGDGLDDLFDNSNSTFAIYRGHDGHTLLNLWAAQWCGSSPENLFEEGLFANQVLGSIVTMEPNGEPQVLFSMNPATMALLDFDGSVAWRTPTDSGFAGESLPVAADLDGDGAMEILAVDHCGTPGSEIRAYNGGNGSVRWTLNDSSMCQGNLAHNPVAADLDGDGRDEVLAVSGSRLVAIAESGEGQGVIRWEAVFDGNPDSWANELGSAVIADVDGDGQPKILVNTADGYLVALGQERETFTINAGVNDAWFNPATPGQGFLITVFPQLGQMFLAWFTFDSRRPDATVMAQFGGAGHRWLTAYGPIKDGSALLDVELTTGGQFDSPEPQPTQTVDGSILVQFSDCRTGLITYDLPAAGLSGQIPVQRVAEDNVKLCESLAPQ